MATEILAELVTPEQLAMMDDEKEFELIDGQLVRRQMGNLAAWVAAEINGRLRSHVREFHLGWVFTSDAGFRLDRERPSHVRRPDVSFVRFGRLPGEAPSETYDWIAPDLAVEVVSPGDTILELEEKIEEYLRSGVRLVWIVFPELRSLRVHKPTGEIVPLRNGDEVTGEDIVEGFRCKLSDLFELPTPAKPSE